MKNALRGIAVAVLLLFGGLAVYRGSVSDETKIGWVFYDGVEAFNAGRLDACMDMFSAGYRDETSGVHPEALLPYVMARERRKGRSWPWCIEIPLDEREVEVLDGEPRRAKVRFLLLLRLATRPGEVAGPLLWVVRVESELLLGDEGWQFARSRHETVSGKRPR